LNTILCRAGCGPKASDNILGDRDFCPRFIAGDSVLLIVVNTIVVDADFGRSATEALHDDGITVWQPLSETESLVLRTALCSMLPDEFWYRMPMSLENTRLCHCSRYPR